jgi:hypothetical protein
MWCERGSLKGLQFIMTYSPNFNDPRVSSRVKTAIGFACAVMSETKSHPWSTRYIDKFFGMSARPLSKWLRQKLLITTNERWNKDTGECKEYILNKEGVNELLEILKISNTNIYPIVTEVALQDHADELKSGNFEYADKSNRLWHPLQRYRKQYRTQVLHDSGYVHDYDIQCCAPTLIHQYAQRLGMDEYLFALREYLNNKHEVRARLAREMELDIAAIKEIINALFCGARIANNPKSDIYEILCGDRTRIEFLKQDEYLTQLRSDIKTCWDHIIPHMPRRRKVNTNRLIQISCKEKWNVYFELERIILNSVRNYLIKESNKHFLIHDGWTCEREVDRDVLRDFVKGETGYEVKFDYEKIAIL